MCLKEKVSHNHRGRLYGTLPWIICGKGRKRNDAVVAADFVWSMSVIVHSEEGNYCRLMNFFFPANFF